VASERHGAYNPPQRFVQIIAQSPRDTREVTSMARSTTRRAFLRGTAAALAAVASRPAIAQQMQTHLPKGLAPKPRGPIVFLDYDKEELDYAYRQDVWAPNAADIAKRNAQKNAAARARLGPPRRFRYGSTEIERLDLYAASRPNPPIHVHIHGGQWRTGSAAGDAFFAEMFVDAGVHFISIDFNSVIDTKGDLMPLAQQARGAVAWVYNNATMFGGDANRLYLSGHSSGAHLAAVVLTTRWQDYGVPMNIVKGGLCCSGMYDLYPVSLSARSSFVNFTAEVVEALSPQRHIDQLVAPLIVAYGALETPEFQRQNRDFAAAVKSSGKAVTLLVGEGYNHFEIRETLASPYALLGRAALAQMRA
jgi:arylformamidase